MIIAVKKKNNKSSCKTNRKHHAVCLTIFFFSLLHANQLRTYSFLSLQLYARSRRPAAGSLFLQARKSTDVFTPKAKVQSDSISTIHTEENTIK